MKLDDIKANTLYSYYIIEDIPDAAERLNHEMNKYAEWKFSGSARGVKQAIKEITESKPTLIFCDWDLIGGSGFEILQHIQNMNGYDPFIIFNTGFQSDHPEIAEELINIYKPDAFINKPYWHKLNEQLSALLQKAIAKSEKEKVRNKPVWLCDIHGKRYPFDPVEIICVLQSAGHPRAKIIYSEYYEKGKEFIITWKEITQILEQHSVSFFLTNKRNSLVVKKFIESYFRPIIDLKKINVRVEIVPDYIKEFEEWI